MTVLNFTLSEEGVSGFRDALICLNKFSDDVSLEARKDSFTLSTLNSSKSAYASFKFATNRFFSRYSYQGNGASKERFHCNIRSAADSQRDRDVEKQTLIDRCDVAIEDGQGVKSRFIARIVFRTGLTSTHRLAFETGAPVHAKFSKPDAPHHWSISSRTLRQLMDHFGPGIDYLDINTDGDHVNFTCFSEKTVSEDAVLKKPLQTSIAVEADEFDDIEVEDKLHIVISVKDFRAIIQHAGIGGSALSARYSLPARPIQFSYAGDALSCEFLIMTVGERGSNPAQKTKKGRKSAPANNAPRLEAASRKTSVAPSEAPVQHPEATEPTQASARIPPPSTSRPVGTIRASVSRMSAFDLRPSQKPPPPTLRSQSLFVDDEGWEPVRDEDEDAEENAQLGWDHSADPDPISTHSFMHMSRPEPAPSVDDQINPPAEHSTILEPTQKLSDVQNLGLFPD
ncbi:DNA repair protein Rad9 [Akanthomyces lecanii RCEF 1005]|uniref:DNA repair protein rad9 n=1 Tax=Akanthomyces lecanii RCEF 1005 TaxID=1081108 RepID=A0A162K9I2_CORDF|nr:DNA repair protein Rad9 [Akanthomyces lecanii RCEF 1005]